MNNSEVFFNSFFFLVGWTGSGSVPISWMRRYPYQYAVACFPVWLGDELKKRDIVCGDAHMGRSRPWHGNYVLVPGTRYIPGTLANVRFIKWCIDVFVLEELMVDTFGSDIPLSLWITFIAFILPVPWILLWIYVLLQTCLYINHVLM